MNQDPRLFFFVLFVCLFVFFFLSRKRKKLKKYTLYTVDDRVTSSRSAADGSAERRIGERKINRSRRKATDGEGLVGRKKPTAFRATRGTRCSSHGSRSRYPRDRCVTDPHLLLWPAP